MAMILAGLGYGFTPECGLTLPVDGGWLAR